MATIKFKKPGAPDNSSFGPPGFYTFNLSSNTTFDENNTPVSYDYILNIDSKIVYNFNINTNMPSIREDLTEEQSSLDWLMEQMDNVKGFYEDLHFYQVDVGPLKFGSGRIRNLSFSDNDDRWNNTFNYNVQIEIPVTGGGTNVGGLKYLDSSTKPAFISSVDDNISVAKNDLYFFDPRQAIIEDNAKEFTGAEYTITRTISAVGKHGSPSGALYYAKNTVNDIFSQAQTWTNLTENLSIADRAVSISSDEIAGSYTLTSVITAYSGSAWSQLSRQYINTYDINVSYSQELKRTVTINGTMKGTKFDNPDGDEGNYIPPRENSPTPNYFTAITYKHKGEDVERFDKLKGLYQSEIGNRLYDLAQSQLYHKGIAEDYDLDNAYKGYRTLIERGNYKLFHNYNFSGNIQGTTKLRLNPIPVDYKITFNMPEQTIDYSVTYDNRTIPIVDGSRNEEIICDDSHGQNLYATHEIFFGAPVLQDLNTYGSNKRTATYSANFQRTKIVDNKLNKETLTKVEKIVDSFDPSFLLGNTEKKPIYLTKFEQNLDRTGKYTMTKSWEW